MVRRLLVVGGFGLLPLWIAIGIVVAGSMEANVPDYWAVAPWLIFASIPLSGVTLALALAALADHRKSKGASGTAWILLLTALMAAGFLLFKWLTRM